MRSYLIFVVVLVMASCSNSSEKSDERSANEPGVGIADIKSTLSSYLLPDQDSLTDENTFVFYKEQRWDTSFVLTLRRDTNMIVGVYHEVSPYNMEAGYLTDVGFFDGFTFTIDSATWDKVLKNQRIYLTVVITFLTPVVSIVDDTYYHIRVTLLLMERTDHPLQYTRNF
jgi:hypothetical protein